MASINTHLHQKPLSVAMPAYNEERTIARIIEKLLELTELFELVVIDDCSSDRTGEIVQNLAQDESRIKYFRQPSNMGKTEALKTGFSLTSGDVVIVQDADLEYDPAEIPDVIAPIIHRHADVVYGSRFLVRKATRVLYFYHFLANKGLTFLSNCFTNLNMTDVETCYKAFRGDIIRSMIITSKGFGFEIEVTAKIAKLKCSVFEVPISYYGRTYEEGKKIHFSDGLAAFWYVIRYNLMTNLPASFSQVPKIRPVESERLVLE
jgi:glycosyltransferase involved in cell wall biosynthesis